MQQPVTSADRVVFSPEMGD